MFVFQIALSSRNQYSFLISGKTFFFANDEKMLSSKRFFDLLLYAVKMTVRRVDILKVLNRVRFLLSMITLILFSNVIKQPYVEV